MTSQFVFQSDRRFLAGGGYRANDVRGTMSHDEFATIAQELVKLPAFGPRWDFVSDVNMPVTYFWIEAGKRTWQVRFPSALDSLEGTAATGEIRRLQGFDRSVTAMGLRDRDQALAPQIRRVRAFGDLQRVVFTSVGCFGTCPAFVATFHRDGFASLDRPKFIAHIRGGHATAKVPFDRVIGALSMVDVATMPHEYGVRAEDTYGASLRLIYADGFTFDVDGPDRTSW